MCYYFEFTLSPFFQKHHHFGVVTLILQLKYELVVKRTQSKAIFFGRASPKKDVYDTPRALKARAKILYAFLSLARSKCAEMAPDIFDFIT